MDYKKLYDPDVKNMLLQMGSWQCTKKEENVILQPYMTYVKQYLNIHNNTIFRVNLRINKGKLGSGHGSEWKWPHKSKSISLEKVELPFP